MKYNPWRTSQSYLFYLATVLYAASMTVIFLLNLLVTTPVLWVYVVLATIGILYFLIVFFVDCLSHWKGKGLTITEDSVSFYDEADKKKITISMDDLLEFKYEKRGKIHFVYKKHGRNDYSFVAQVFSKKECTFLDSIIEKIAIKDAKVNLHK